MSDIQSCNVFLLGHCKSSPKRCFRSQSAACPGLVVWWRHSLCSRIPGSPLPGAWSPLLSSGQSGWKLLASVLTITWTRRKNPSPDLISFYNYTSPDKWSTAADGDEPRGEMVRRKTSQIFQCMLSFRAYLYGLLLVCSVRSEECVTAWQPSSNIHFQRQWQHDNWQYDVEKHNYGATILWAAAMSPAGWR